MTDETVPGVAAHRRAAETRSGDTHVIGADGELRNVDAPGRDDAAVGPIAELPADATTHGGAARPLGKRRPAQVGSDNADLLPVDHPEVLVTATFGMGGQHIVTAPWLSEPETFADVAAAEARQAELRAAGPPEGWAAVDATHDTAA